MLHDFIARHRTELLAECVRELRDRYPNRTDCELIGKLDCFIDELTIALAHDATAPLATTSLGNPGAASGREHGITRRMQGFDLNRVVHDFGLVCEISTSTAIRY